MNKTVKQSDSGLRDQATVVWSIRRMVPPSWTPLLLNVLLRITGSKSLSMDGCMDGLVAKHNWLVPGLGRCEHVSWGISPVLYTLDYAVTK